MKNRKVLVSFALVLFAGISFSYAADKPGEYKVPYRILQSNHIGVRVKLNGEGPFTFIIDTGAPGVVLTPDMAARFGVKPDKDQWGTLAKLEVEGGPTMENVRTYVLEGVPVAGGIIGYTALAQFKIELDFSKPAMIWTKKSWDAPRPLTRRELGMPQRTTFGGAGGNAPAAYLGIQPDPSSSPIRIVSVLDNAPAEKAGVKAGDVILEFNGQEIATAQEMMKLIGVLKVGDEVKLKLRRGGEIVNLSVTAAPREQAMLGARPAPPRNPGNPLGGRGVTATGYIGVEFDPVAPPCKIAAVHAGSPADKAGLKVGDVVTEFSARPVKSPDDVARLAGQVVEGAEVSLKIERGGETQTINVKAASGF